jgi:radical SAM superfamily enzyme YgiQ (UPF0313 family)
MRIVLINPNPMTPPVAPLALDYIGSACDAAGIAVDLVDCSVDRNWRQTLACALARDPILVGISSRNIDDSYFASRDFSLQRIVPVIEEVRRLTTAPICLGGVGFSIFPFAAMEFCQAPFGISGDGEDSLVKLVQAFTGKLSLDKVPGLVRKEKGYYKSNPVTRTSLAKMDLSARSLIDNRFYLEHGGQVGFESKRGCSLNCTYCPEPSVKGRNVRLRHPKNVVAELNNLCKQGVNVLHTCDSEFNCPHDHAIAVSKAMIESNLGNKIKWYAYCTPHNFSDELAGLMRRAGCVGIDFGADHGDQSMLRRLGHRYSAEDLMRIRDICHRHDIICMFDLLLGSPGETRTSIATTIRLMKKLKPERVGISLGVRVYPVTAMGKEIVATGKGNLSKNPNLFGDLENNESMLRPLFYCHAQLGDDVEEWLHDLIGDDPRFLLGRRSDAELNYNYNDNPELTAAIARGHRGAFWDILRRVSEGVDPL